MQILTFKSHPWCSNSNAICQQGLQNTIRLARHWRPNTLRAGLVSTLLDSALLNLYPYSTLPLPLPLPLALLYLYSALLYSTLLFSTLRCLYPTPTLLTASLLYAALLYSALLFSTIFYPILLLLYLDSTSRRCPLDTVISGLVRMWLHDLLTQVPTGHNEIWARENVTSWSLTAGAHWTQWSLG